MKTQYNTLIIGTGCAGFNAADKLFDLGVRDIAIISEGRCMGTSRNTGSDKQTYYKLSLCGKDGDSVREMAETLYSGGGVMGDLNLDILKEIIKRGYDKWVFVEHDTHLQDPLIDLKTSREYIRRAGI